MAKYHGTMTAPTSTNTKINGVKIMIMACKSLYDVIRMVYAHINSLPYNDDRLELFSRDFPPRFFPTSNQRTATLLN